MCTKDEASSYTVYLALKKEKGNNLKDTSHRPKRKHPNHLPEEIGIRRKRTKRYNWDALYPFQFLQVD